MKFSKIFKRDVRKAKKEVNKIEHEFKEEVEEVEKWVIERRKFFIKLGAVIVFILILLIILQFI
jgi:hypothetical protein